MVHQQPEVKQIWGEKPTKIDLQVPWEDKKESQFSDFMILKGCEDSRMDLGSLRRDHLPPVTTTILSSPNPDHQEAPPIVLLPLVAPRSRLITPSMSMSSWLDLKPSGSSTYNPYRIGYSPAL